MANFERQNLGLRKGTRPVVNFKSSVFEVRLKSPKIGLHRTKVRQAVGIILLLSRRIPDEGLRATCPASRRTTRAVPKSQTIKIEADFSTEGGVDFDTISIFVEVQFHKLLQRMRDGHESSVNKSSAHAKPFYATEFITGIDTF